MKNLCIRRVISFKRISISFFYRKEKKEVEDGLRVYVYKLHKKKPKHVIKILRVGASSSKLPLWQVWWQ